MVMKSGSLNLLEPSGTVRACNGIALPLPIPFIRLVSRQIVLLSALQKFLHTDCCQKKGVPGRSPKKFHLD